MPPRLSEYEAADWLHLRPFTHWLKTRRYRQVDQAYCALPARAGNAQSIGQAISGRNTLVSIAFTDPDVIGWQAELVRLYVPDTVYVVADNTPDDTRAEMIAAVANKFSVPYIRLPSNPWNEPSRSHGLGLNWVWRNVIEPAAPQAFGFLDDDMFPTAPDDPFAVLNDQDFYGVVRNIGQRWFLWAGFCMFRFDRVKAKPLDFGQDWFVGLDTGGGNWEVLYRHGVRESMRERETFLMPYKPGLEVADAPFQWCGTWLHEVGVMGKAEFASDKRRVLVELLAPHLAKARSAFAETGSKLSGAYGR